MRFIYLILLILMFYIIYKGIVVSKRTPFKIKVLVGIALIGLFFRNIVLFIMFIMENIAYLYVLKPFVYLNLICIPLLVIIIMCILARNNKINFSYLFIVAILFVAVYILFITRVNSSISMSEYCGYILNFDNEKIIYIFQLSIYSFSLIYGILKFKDKKSTKSLIFLTMIISVVSIGEILLSINNIRLIPNFLISDCLWITLGDYILYKIKK